MTTMHKVWLFFYIGGFCLKLMWRAVRHDCSKFHEPEAYAFAINRYRLKREQFGSPAYDRMINRHKLGRGIAHHHRHNRHHPEYFENGISGMHLADLCMMFFDWMATVRLNENGHIILSIEKGEQRFSIPPELTKIFMNTAGKAKYHE